MEEKTIQARAVIEILGSPKDHVEDTLRLVISKAKESFKLLTEKTYEATEVEGLWSAFSELEISFKNMDDLVVFCFNFMPSSVDIIEPMNFDLKCSDMSNMLNDLLAKLHRYDMVVKNLTAENVILKKKQEKQSPL